MRSPRVCRGPRRARYVWREASRTWEVREVPGGTQGGGFERSAEDLSGVRSTDSTRRTGEPSTGGSGGQRFAVCTGNRRRARRTGATPANLPAGDSGQGGQCLGVDEFPLQAVPLQCHRRSGGPECLGIARLSRRLLGLHSREPALRVPEQGRRRAPGRQSRVPVLAVVLLWRRGLDAVAGNACRSRMAGQASVNSRPRPVPPPFGGTKRHQARGEVVGRYRGPKPPRRLRHRGGKSVRRFGCPRSALRFGAESVVRRFWSPGGKAGMLDRLTEAKSRWASARARAAIAAPALQEIQDAANVSLLLVEAGVVLF